MSCCWTRSRNTRPAPPAIVLAAPSGLDTFSIGTTQRAGAYLLKLEVSTLKGALTSAPTNAKWEAMVS